MLVDTIPANKFCLFCFIVLLYKTIFKHSISLYKVKMFRPVFCFVFSIALSINWWRSQFEILISGIYYYLGWPDPSCRGERFIQLEEKPDFQEYDWLFFLLAVFMWNEKLVDCQLCWPYWQAFHKELDNY